MQSTWKA